MRIWDRKVWIARATLTSSTGVKMRIEASGASDSGRVPSTMPPIAKAANSTQQIVNSHVWLVRCKTVGAVVMARWCRTCRARADLPSHLDLGAAG
jgi:hypothetical protein